VAARGEVNGGTDFGDGHAKSWLVEFTF